MAHKTLVGGTAYNISGGKSMVSGTTYNITGGRTLVSGTGYNISFGGGEPTAMLYSDGNMVFQLGSGVESGKTLTASYTGFENASYSNPKSVPWDTNRTGIKNVRFDKEFSPVSISYWFYYFGYMVNFDFVNFNMNNVTNMVSAYENCHSLTGSPVCGNNVTNMYYTYAYCYNLTGSPVCGSNVTNMYCTYDGCYNLTGSPVCGNNVTNMSFAYYNCLNLTGSPVCGNNVTDMSSAYYNCLNLTGSPVCGNNVTRMSYAYYNCFNLTGSPVCGNNVTRMDSTYQDCYNLTGSPVCGNNVTDMSSAYYNCLNLTGSPVCGNNVTNMSFAYYNCLNLTGSPVCGNNVTDMSSAYYNCLNLTGSPVCGNNVTRMDSTYQNCINIGRNAYFYSPLVELAYSCFEGKNNSRRLNLYVPANSTTNNTVHGELAFTLVGLRNSITWTNAGSYQYNTAYNIYIYPVANVAAAAIANGDEEANVNAGIIVDDSGGDNTGGGSSSSANYTVTSVSGASYGFALNSNGYYESNNQGQSSSAALCKVTFIADGVSNVYFDCINYAESNWDYGLLSTVDKTLTTSNSADSSNVFKSFKGSQSASVQTVNYGILSAGEHFVYVKYIKDSSVDVNYDSLQFKVRFE